MLSSAARVAMHEFALAPWLCVRPEISPGLPFSEPGGALHWLMAAAPHKFLMF